LNQLARPEWGYQPRDPKSNDRVTLGVFVLANQMSRKSSAKGSIANDSAPRRSIASQAVGAGGVYTKVMQAIVRKVLVPATNSVRNVLPRACTPKSRSRRPSLTCVLPFTPSAAARLSCTG